MSADLAARGRRESGRAGPIVLLLLHLFVAGWAPLADALLEAGQERSAHIEANSGASCGYAHAHTVCQLCRIVGLNGAAGGGRHPLSTPPTTRAEPTRSPVVAVIVARRHAPGSPRAPPTTSSDIA